MVNSVNGFASVDQFVGAFLCPVLRRWMRQCGRPQGTAREEISLWPALWRWWGSFGKRTGNRVAGYFTCAMGESSIWRAMYAC